MEKLVNVLLDKGLKIATAESCTGGLLAKKITDVSGASKIFEMGLVAYANRIKQEFLGVPEEVLTKKGAVSHETAEAMARGVARISKADIGVGITGIAGPTGGTPEKPVGLVYFAVYFNGEVTVNELKLLGNRDEIREQTTKEVAEYIYSLVK